MILDTSAVVAIVFREPGFEALVEKVASADGTAVGAPTAAEIGVVLSARLHRDARGLLARLPTEWGAEVVPFGDDHRKEAIDAYRR